MATIGTLAQVKKLFFDAARIKAGIASAAEKVLSKFGAFVRSDSRQSIRKAPRVSLADMAGTDRAAYRRKQDQWRRGGKQGKRPTRPAASSKPGRPPYSHTGLLREIYFAMDGYGRVVIGPVKLNAKGRDIPKALEYGGESSSVTGGVQRRITIQERPYMRPAFNKNLPSVAPLWRNAVK